MGDVIPPRKINEDAATGRRIHQLMWDRKMTQAAFGESVGMSQASVAKKLRGAQKWSLAELRAVAASLSTTIGYLVGETPENGKLPHLDSNQEPIGSGFQQAGAPINMGDYRKAKEEAHKAVRSSKHGNGEVG